MAVELVILPEASQDLADAYAWYEYQRVGLGEDFLSCVDACVERIRRAPQFQAIAFDVYRRAVVRRFPYAIFYEYADETVTIFCVFHTARDPKKWQRRLP